MDGGEWCRNTDDAFPRAQKDKVMEYLQTRKDRWGNRGTRKGKKRDRWHISVRFYPRDMSCTYNINELKMTYFECLESNSVSADLKNYYMIAICHMNIKDM